MPTEETPCLKGILCDHEPKHVNTDTPDYKAEEEWLFPERYRDID